MMRTAQARKRDASLTLTSGPARGTAAAGSTFTLLLLLSAGMAAVPVAADPVERVRDFYLRHAGVVVVAQLVALLAAASFALFSWLLAATAGSPAHRVACGAQDKPSRSWPPVPVFQCYGSAPRPTTGRTR
jgi:hypothetical protein